MATEVLSNRSGGLLILTDDFGERQVAIPCNDDTLVAFSERLDNNEKHARKLPDVLIKILLWQTDIRLEIVFDSVKDGNYHALICNLDTLDQLPIDAADAVLLNFLSKGKIPLYMEEGFFTRQSTRFDANAEGVALPINSITDEMLEEALKKAIADEKYEIASQLNNEIKRRKTDKDNEDVTDTPKQA